jgi:hypothetical protein
VDAGSTLLESKRRCEIQDSIEPLIRLSYDGPMRWARSYSIIDHQILHGRYLHRLSHESMILYLFLVVVGDRQGRSFYSDRSIMEILRLNGPKLHQAREELISEGLISYRRPYWEVKNIPQRRGHGRDDKAIHPLPSRSPGTELLSDPGPDGDLTKARLAYLSRILSEQETKEGLYSGPLSLPDRGVVQRASDLKGSAGPRVVKDERSKDKLPGSGQVYEGVP